MKKRLLHFRMACFRPIVVLGLSGLFLGACQEPHRVFQDEGPPSDSKASELPVGKVEASVESKIDFYSAPPEQAAKVLFGVMDSFGPKAEENFVAAKDSFLKRKDAFDVLSTIYNESFAGKYSRLQRWKSVYLIGQLYTEESVDFLKSVIFRPEPERNIEQEDTDKKATHYLDDDLEIKLTAATALVSSYDRHVHNAESVIHSVILDGDKSVVSEMALDLFSIKKLQPFIQLLSSRGVFYDFRRMTEKEKESTFHIEPNDLLFKDGKSLNLTDPVSFSN